MENSGLTFTLQLRIIDPVQIQYWYSAGRCSSVLIKMHIVGVGPFECLAVPLHLFFLFTVLFSEEKYQELSGDMYLAVIVGQ